MLPSFEELTAAAAKLRAECGSPKVREGEDDLYAKAIATADCVFGIYPDPSGQVCFFADIVKGDWDALGRGNWTAIHLTDQRHAGAIAMSFGRIGIDLTFEEASREYDRLAYQAILDDRPRLGVH